jgi:hypothetical protein
LKVQLTFSCYLVKHGDDYLVWDTGVAVGANAVADRMAVDNLAVRMIYQGGGFIIGCGEVFIVALVLRK